MKGSHLGPWASEADRPANLAEHCATPWRTEPIDESTLEGLHRLHRDGLPDIAKTVIMLFLESAPAPLRDLEQGAARNDASLLQRASRILASGSASVGARRLSSRCKDLEAIARTGSVPDAARRVEVIGRLYGEAEGALRAWCLGRG